MLIKNACIENNEELKCIRIEDGKFKEIKKDLEPYAQEEVMDLEGKLVLPPFVESHVHLDTCLTAGQPHWNMSGTLFEGIERWEERKDIIELRHKAAVDLHLKRAEEERQAALNSGLEPGAV